MVDKECIALLDKLDLNRGKNIMYLFPRLEEYTEQQLAELRANSPFSPNAYLRENLKWILIRFFDLYLTGTVQKEDAVTSIIFDMIALSETKKGRVWSITPEKLVSTYPENGSKPNSLLAVTVNATFELTFLKKSWGKKQTEFWNYINTVIENINPADTVTKAETQVIRLASFLALNLLQFAIKERHQIVNCFKRSQFRKNMEDIGIWPAENPYSSPCDKCLDICDGDFGKASKSSEMARQLLIDGDLCTCSPGIKLINAGLLDDIAGYGMGIIKLVHDARGIIHVSWRDLRTLTTLPVTQHSWNVISNVFESQESNLQHTLMWARVINDRYFQELSPKRNIPLATILAAIIEKAEGPEIWNAKWAKKANNNLKLFGYRIYELIHKGSK